MPHLTLFVLDLNQVSPLLVERQFDVYHPLLSTVRGTSASLVEHDMLEQPTGFCAMNPLTIKVACSNCNLRELCMPAGPNEEQQERID